MHFIQLVKINLLMIIRNRNGLFWTLVMPVVIYVGLSILPIGVVLGNSSYSSYLLPGVIALTIMQGGIYTFAYWIIDLRARGIIKQLSLTTITKSGLVLSFLTARCLTMIMQAVLLTIIGILFFGIHISGPIIWIPVFILLGGFVFLTIGLLISDFANNYDAAAPITAGLGMAFTFLGNVFYPTQLLPGYLHAIAKFLPITFLADGLRQIYTQAPALGDLYGDLLWLALWVVVIFTFAGWRFRMQD